MDIIFYGNCPKEKGYECKGTPRTEGTKEWESNCCAPLDPNDTDCYYD